MPQVKERLTKEFNIEPKLFDPDQSVAKGAAIHGQMLSIGTQVRINIGREMGIDPDKVDMDNIPTQLIDRVQQTVANDSGLSLGFVKKAGDSEVVNVVSHSFGMISVDTNTRPYTDVISNLVKAGDKLPKTGISVTKTFRTLEQDQERIDLQIMENTSTADVYRDINSAIEIGTGVINLPPRLPEGAPVEVTFDLNSSGLLHVIAREIKSGRQGEVTVQTAEGLTQQEVKEITERSAKLTIS